MIRIFILNTRIAEETGKTLPNELVKIVGRIRFRRDSRNTRTIKVRRLWRVLITHIFMGHWPMKKKKKKANNMLCNVLKVMCSQIYIASVYVNLLFVSYTFVFFFSFLKFYISSFISSIQ